MMRPSQMLGCMFEDLQDEIRILRKEVARLETENNRLVLQSVHDADLMSRRTLALALSGALQKPDVGLKELGYSETAETGT